MSAERDLKRLYERHAELDRKSKDGDRAAKEEKNKVVQDIRATEREGHRAGKVYNTAIDKSGKATVTTEHTDSLYDLKTQYIAKFDDQTPVNVGGMVQTLRDFTKRRLGRKK